MITDYDTMCSKAQAITADAASAASYMVNKDASDGIGDGEPIKAWLTVTEAFNNLTTLDVIVQGTVTVTNGTPDFTSTVELCRKQVALAGLTKGAEVVLPFLSPGVDVKALRFYFDVTGTAPTTGKVNAGFTPYKFAPANAGASL